jgi:hypothetical protein
MVDLKLDGEGPAFKNMTNCFGDHDDDDCYY